MICLTKLKTRRLATLTVYSREVYVTVKGELRVVNWVVRTTLRKPLSGKSEGSRGR